MKAVLGLLLLACPLRAEEEKGTVWYDSGGKVVLVEKPSAAKAAPEPWVPQWVAREERRDRALRGGYRRSGCRDGIYPAWGWGWSFPVRYCRPCPPPPCARPFSGIRVIIR